MLQPLERKLSGFFVVHMQFGESLAGFSKSAKIRCEGYAGQFALQIGSEALAIAWMMQ